MTPEQEIELLKYELDRIKKEHQPFVPPEGSEELAERIGHLQPCYYCGEPTNMFAGNPSLWPLQLGLCDGTGIARDFHWGCVAQRLYDNVSLRERAEAAEREIVALRDVLGSLGVAMGDYVPRGKP